MHWISAFPVTCSHSAQAVRKHIRRPNRAQMTEFWRDLAGLTGLAVFVASWIGTIGFLGL